MDQPTLQVLNHFFMLVGPPGAAGSLGARAGPGAACYLGARAGPGAGYLGWLPGCL